MRLNCLNLKDTFLGGHPRSLSLSAGIGEQQGSHEPQVGSNLGEYHLISHLGNGGMGIVYKALYLPTEKAYALKWFRPGRADPFEIRNVFVRCAGLNHPGVVRFRDMDEEANFLVMDLVEGLGLRWKLKQTKLLPLNDVLKLALSLCDSVQVLHSAGVLHQDIRPINIHMTQTGPVLIDVGIPYRMNTPEKKINLARSGSAAYIAPEVLLGHKPTVRSDVYSLAAVLYRALVGKRPARNQDGEYLTRSTVEMGKSEALLQLLRVGLSQSSKCRFSTMNAMACALKSVKRESL